MEKPASFHDVRAAGARGDGNTDDSPAFENLLRSGAASIYVPPGEYAVARPIRLRSGTRLLAHPLARVRIADGAEWGVRDALLTNAEWERGDAHIEVSGGIWDGNCRHVRRAAEDERDGYTGNLMIFRNVEHLVLKDLHLADPASYFVALGKVRKFRVEHIRFEILHHTRNQDGIHVSGHCEDGFIREITGYGKYCPGDDLVALNADDALDRSETRSCLAGPIRRIVVSGLRAEDCHAFIRFASVWSTIEDVVVRDLEGGCVDAAINADCLRFCRSPLFEIDDPAFAQGCGDLRNIHLSGLRIWKTRDLGSGMLQLHARLQNCTVEDFERVFERDANPAHPSLDLRFLPGAQGQIEGLTPEDAQRLASGSRDANLGWEELPFADLSASAFTLGQEGRLTGNPRRFSRLHVASTPLHPLPTPDWNKGMTR
jgi:hypothetical protein